MTDTVKNKTEDLDISELAGVFSNQSDLQNAVTELQSAGIARRHISVLASSAAVDAAYGDNLPAVKALIEDTEIPVNAPVTEEDLGIAYGAIIGASIIAGVVSVAIAVAGMFAGTPGLATVAAGAIFGAAGGAYFAKSLSDKHAEYLKKQLENGGFVLWVSIPTKAKEIAATYILRKNGAEAIEAAA